MTPRTRGVRSRRARVAGLTTHYLEAGAGPPVVLLASMLIRARSYLPLIRRLATQFRVVAVELPGSGASARLRRPWSWAEYARFTERFLETLGGPPPVLVGHSNSGPVGLLLAERAPGRVAALVLADSVGARPRVGLGRVLAARAWDALFEWRLDVRAAHHVLYNLLRHPRSWLAQVALSCRARLVLPRAAEVPVLIAWGRRDRTMPLAAADRFQARLANAWRYVGRGRHDWLVLRPREFLRALQGFWRLAVLEAPQAVD